MSCEHQVRRLSAAGWRGPGVARRACALTILVLLRLSTLRHTSCSNRLECLTPQRTILSSASTTPHLWRRTSRPARRTSSHWWRKRISGHCNEEAGLPQPRRSTPRGERTASRARQPRPASATQRLDGACACPVLRRAAPQPLGSFASPTWPRVPTDTPRKAGDPRWLSASTRAPRAPYGVRLPRASCAASPRVGRTVVMGTAPRRATGLCLRRVPYAQRLRSGGAVSNRKQATRVRADTTSHRRRCPTQRPPKPLPHRRQT